MKQTFENVYSSFQAIILPVEVPVLHAPSTIVPHAATVRPTATPRVSKSVLVQNTTIFNNSKAKTKLQREVCNEERKVTLVVASPEIPSSITVVAYVFLCVNEEAERERQKDCERARVAIEHIDGEGDDRKV
ncbi:hypothetical protein DVH24_039366 [Malus domestica]|uniref:Uncharacterized protein n=1 Tax=Malus domestica TaxID=3750 RepID=A0A498I1B8_MALDO|nr:hypothetical protein DVH24_039366 [Malus domestica]